MQRNAGFTLIELLVVVAILGLLGSMLVSMANNAVAAAHSAAARTALSTTLIKALNASTVISQEVVVCASRDGRGCSGGIDWSPGWIAFADPNGNRSRDVDETLVASEGRLHQGQHLRSSIGRTHIVFQPYGGATAGSNVTFTFCDRRGADKASTLVLANSGRLRSGVANATQGAACLEGA